MIPVYEPLLEGNEKNYVNECIESTWISSKGEFISRFENEFANYVDVKFASTVSNGTVALHLALVTLGIGEGDEVIVPTLTYIASVNAIAYTGAKPIFIDSLEKGWQMDPKEIEKKITKKTKAVMAVHLYGHPCEMDMIQEICNKHNLFLIEDCAEAIGSRFRDRHVGTFGHISTFSFFGNKTITTGEGGMVITNDKTLHERATHFKGQGLAKFRQYWHDVIGYNYRMTNLCAAIGLAQLEKIDQILTEKQRVAQTYQMLLKDTEYEFHMPNSKHVDHSYWMCSILTNDYLKREELRNYLAKANIETRPLFYPVHTMPMYSDNFKTYPIAEDLGRRGINLPSYPGLKNSQIEYICEKIKEFSFDNSTR